MAKGLPLSKNRIQVYRSEYLVLSSSQVFTFDPNPVQFYVGIMRFGRFWFENNFIFSVTQ
jgi:hypothetical protein